jgi:hypothetical protein
MIASKTLLGLATVQAVSAHFGLIFPTWRADTLSEENEDRYNQWTYPCTYYCMLSLYFSLLTKTRCWCRLQQEEPH